MIPLHDDNPTRTLPIVTVSILIACVLAFLWQLLHEPQVQELLVTSLGLIPAALLGDFRPAQPLYSLPPSITLVTSMFLHGGWMHLIGNMLYLWIFGNNVEDAIMRASSGSICSAACRGVIRHINPAVPIASGAILRHPRRVSAHPRARVLVLLVRRSRTWCLPACGWVGFVTDCQLAAGKHRRRVAWGALSAGSSPDWC